jgi:RNA polymerase sigma-70 factor (ECF subfamily)
MPALATTPLPELPELMTDVTFESVYEELFAFVWRTARRLGVSESSVDDVCQEVFVAVHRGLPSFEGRASLKTWVFGILQNHIKTHRRSLARKSPALRSVGGTVDPELVGSPDDNPYELVSSAQALRLAHDVLDSMDDEKRTVFVLVELEQWSVADTASAIGANVNTVHARLRAARKEFTQAAHRIRIRDGWRSE